MTDLLNLLEGSWQFVLRSTLEACVIVAAIRILQLSLRDRLAPRWHYALWLILVVRLLMPWSPSSAVSIFNVVRLDTVPITVTPPEMTTRAAAQEVVALPPEAFMPAAETYVAPATPAPVVASESVIASEPFTMWHATALVWAAGTLALLLYIAMRNIALARMVHRAQPITDPEALAVIDECRAQLGVRRTLRTAVVDAKVTPALFGLFRPRLLVPEGLTETMDRDRLRHIFLHELAHYKRRDILVNWVMTLLVAVHWFNPLMWYAFSRMRADRELACDALALSHTRDDEAQAYGLTIVELLQRQTLFRRLPGTVGILEERRHLKRRIAAIALFKKNSYRWTAFAAGILLVAGGVLLTDATARGQETDNAEEESDPSEAPTAIDPMDQHVMVRYEEWPLRDALEDLAAKMGRTIRFEGSSGDGRVTADLGDIPLGRAFDVIARLNGLTVDLSGPDEIVISPAAPEPPQPARAPREPEAAPQWESPEPVTAAPALPAAEPAPAPEPAVVAQAQPDEKPTAVPAPKPAPAPKPEPVDPEIEGLLDENISIMFEDIHLSEIVEFIVDTYSINIVLDTRVIRPALEEGDDPTKYDDQRYVTDGMVPYINLRDIPLRNALDAVLRPLDLDFVVEPGYLWISSGEFLNERTTVKTAVAPSISASTLTRDPNDAAVNPEMKRLLEPTAPDQTTPTPATPRSSVSTETEALMREIELLELKQEAERASARGDHRAAVEAYKRALELTPGDAELDNALRNELEHILEELRDSGGSTGASQPRASIESKPILADIPVLNHLFKGQVKPKSPTTEELEHARQTLKTINQRVGAAIPLFDILQAARTALESGDDENAIRLYEHALRHDPDNQVAKDGLHRATLAQTQERVVPRPGEHVTDSGATAKRVELNRVMRQIGLAMKMFANESKGEKYPAMDSTAGSFRPEMDQFAPKYLADETSISALRGDLGTRLVYTGFMLTDDEEAEAFLNAYQQQTPTFERDKDIVVGEGKGNGNSDTIYRLREGIERFLITDIHDPRQSAQRQSEIPILWQMPQGEEKPGGHVLYLDGHVEWVPYPSRFPMTENFIGRLQPLLAQDGDNEAANAPANRQTLAQRRERSDREMPEKTDAERKSIEEILSDPVSMVFEDIHLQEIVDFIEKTYEISIDVDAVAVAPKAAEGEQPSKHAQVKVPSEDGTEYYVVLKEYATDGIVPYISLKNVTLREALTAILRPLNLDFRVEEEGIRISTPEQLQSNAEAEKTSQSERDTAPLRLLRIASGPNGPRVQIRTPDGATRWYDVGDEFEEYKLLEIDPDGGDAGEGTKNLR